MSGGRFLRSKRLRAALWLAAGGRCQRCGRLLPDDWHADHVIPWSACRETNVFGMEALCPDCNRKKGAKMDLETGRRLAGKWLEAIEGWDGLLPFQRRNAKLLRA